jgi:UDP-perosamine 4-acetyltransferase
MDIVLIGAGGHAKAVVEALLAQGHRITGYCDRQESPWLAASRLDDDSAVIALDASIGVALGVGGIDPAGLERRIQLLARLRRPLRPAPPVIHPAATISASATVEDGATILAGAVVQPGARICMGAIINTGAIVEHDSAIGQGTHISPRAVVLADCVVGAHCMVGAGAVILPGSRLDDDILVPAMTRFPR